MDEDATGTRADDLLIRAIHLAEGQLAHWATDIARERLRDEVLQTIVHQIDMTLGLYRDQPGLPPDAVRTLLEVLGERIAGTLYGLDGAYLFWEILRQPSAPLHQPSPRRGPGDRDETPPTTRGGSRESPPASRSATEDRSHPETPILADPRADDTTAHDWTEATY